MLKSKDLQPRLLYPARLSFKIEGEIRSFPDKKKLKEFVNTFTVQVPQHMLKGLLEEEEEKGKEKQTRGKESNDKMELNGTKYVSIKNHLKCKWLKCSNQKT